MSVPPYNPLPVVPTNVDPRFRYGTRAIPENFQQATSRFYLPNQRESRFWPLFYEAREDNECFDALAARAPPPCQTDDDCLELINKWCNDGQARTVKYRCIKTQLRSNTVAGTCQYEFDAF
jgi:hypothetical protein